MRLKLDKQNTGRILEMLYLLVFAAFIAWSFLNTTKFEIVWPNYFYSDLKALLLLVIIVKAGYMGNYSKSDILSVFLIGAVILLNVSRNGYTELEILLLLIIGAKGIDLKDIVKVYFIVTTLLLIITIAAALTGRIENLVYLQEGRRSRMALGIGYPTDFSAYVFYDVIAYIYIRSKKIKYIELAVLFASGIGVYLITDARLNTICIIAAVCIFFYLKIREDYGRKRQKECQINKLWSFLLALSPVLCGAFMIICSILYSSGSRITDLLDRILNYRLYQGNKAIDIFGFTLWGQYIPMQGYGGTTDMPKHYFFLDSSYLSIVMQYGLLIFGIVLFIWIIISFRARKEKNWILLWIVAVISVQCMIEHHMLEIAYNPFILAVFAETVKTNKRPVIEKLYNRVRGKRNGKQIKKAVN